MNQPLIELKNITKVYGSGDSQVQALNDVSISISAGELVAVMGASGSGKSSLLAIAGGLDSPTSGSGQIDGVPLFSKDRERIAKLRRQTIGYVFQDFNLIPALTVVQNVALPLELDGIPASRARAEALAALGTMGIETLAKRFPDEISGGQRQRVAIARSFVGQRRVILADEPTGALDSRTGESVIRALRERIDGGAAGILVTHDAKNAAWADRILLLKDGVITSETKTVRRAEGLLSND